MQQPPAQSQGTSRYSPAGSIGWIEALLVLAALGAIMVGALAMRLGPRWPRRLFFRAPAGIVIHHTATGAHVEGKRVTAELISKWHEARGFRAEYRGQSYHIGYHYLILPDGTVQRGRPDWMMGAHTSGHNDYLGICLVGDFDSASNPAGREKPSTPTKEQLGALVKLLTDLLVKYRLHAEDICRHSDLAPTACPGDRFPMKEVLRRVKAK